jgi:SOS-response transcriptional repressor LexA
MQASPSPVDPTADGPLAAAEVEWIKARRLTLGYPTMEALAADLLIGDSHLSKLLGGSRNARPLVRERIIAVLSRTSREAPINGSGVEPPGPPWNTLGRVEDLMPPGAVELPVYKWGIAGDPLQFGQEDGPIPDHTRFPNPLKYSLISQHGFGVLVRGTSMEARGVQDGDLAWVNPKRGYQLGSVVAALVVNGNGDSGLVIKGLARDAAGEYLVSQPERGVRHRVACESFRVLGPVVTVTREFAPE